MNINDMFATRQVHLDFHTSPDISGIGSQFSKENFQRALKKGNVDSITVFAKCHHGFCYYPTKVGNQHPGLDFDLTGAMVDAAHEIGVRAPIYITAGWSHNDAMAHFDWRSVNRDGLWLVSVILTAFGLERVTGVIWCVETLLLCYWLFRVLSCNVAARRREVERFFGFFHRQKCRYRDRKTHVYRKCVHCKALLRLPKRKGKHTVCCPVCKERFSVHI